LEPALKLLLYKIDRSINCHVLKGSAHLCEYGSIPFGASLKFFCAVF
jgi:hypothetical protein